ncbi:hypothetical protein [Pelotomaculum propionicicum]|uniref:Uncharacterized protein n=1 Tax=Pelotomaculum propionicicum TaxID=258475 RepID=A0A4Y7RY35_9FIRM|nr:hypothetical protein [Pelotomaculum propionicicum]NLI13566.1 hypothetical protein [Peptococcaceae bacterium]TEB13753.1 hypothetical protein Pmgp_00161 [Pelotomaculum propionicicum]
MDKRDKFKKIFHELRCHHKSHEEYKHICDRFEQHRMYRREFHRMHRSMRYFRPFALLLNALIIYLLFKLTGMKTFVFIIAALLVAKEIVQVLFLIRLEKRVFKPIEELKNGVEELIIVGANLFAQCCILSKINSAPARLVRLQSNLWLYKQPGAGEVFSGSGCKLLLLTKDGLQVRVRCADWLDVELLDQRVEHVR